MLFFFFNDTATTEIYTLSLHDALPIWLHERFPFFPSFHDRGTGVQGDIALLADLAGAGHAVAARDVSMAGLLRSEEHTSELQSRQYLVCRLLLEKKKQ